MIELGQEVNFIPNWNIRNIDSKAERNSKTVTGTVIYVNHQHRTFIVEYPCGGTMQKETFKFSDISEEVQTVGGGKHGRKKNH